MKLIKYSGECLTFEFDAYFSGKPFNVAPGREMGAGRGIVEIGRVVLDIDPPALLVFLGTKLVLANVGDGLHPMSGIFKLAGKDDVFSLRFWAAFEINVKQAILTPRVVSGQAAGRTVTTGLVEPNAGTVRVARIAPPGDVEELAIAPDEGGRGSRLSLRVRSMSKAMAVLIVEAIDYSERRRRARVDELHIRREVVVERDRRQAVEHIGSIELMLFVTSTP